MGPGLRKLVLATHVTTSVGWLGAVVAFLGLSVAALVTHEAQLIRGAYVVMQPIGWYVLVPLSVASLLTGVIQSLGSQWGLFRHYWVVVKLVINLFATVILLLYMQTLAALADVAVAARSSADVLAARTSSPVVHAGGAVVLLVVATVLSIYKPRGLTRHGRRAQRAKRSRVTAEARRANSS